MLEGWSRKRPLRSFQEILKLRHKNKLLLAAEEVRNP